MGKVDKMMGGGGGEGGIVGWEMGDGEGTVMGEERDVPEQCEDDVDEEIRAATCYHEDRDGWNWRNFSVYFSNHTGGMRLYLRMIANTARKKKKQNPILPLLVFPFLYLENEFEEMLRSKL